MRMSVTGRASRTIWILLGVLLLMLVVSVPVFCETPCSSSSTCTTTPTEIDPVKYRATHLPWAVVDNPAIVGQLIRNGEDVNASDEDGRVGKCVNASGQMSRSIDVNPAK